MLAALAAADFVGVVSAEGLAVGFVGLAAGSAADSSAQVGSDFAPALAIAGFATEIASSLAERP
jgi:hypothetical protein